MERCYVSLAVYSKQDIAARLVEALGVEPTRTGSKGGVYSWIYSTQDEVGDSVETHVEILRRTLGARTEALIQMFGEGLEVRLWVFLGVEEINRAFVLSVDTLTWLVQFGADVCVDVWHS